MKDELVHIKNKDVFTTSEIIAEKTDNQHRAIVQLIEKHKFRFEKLGTFTFQMRKSKGRPTKFYILNESQATFLITLLRNNEIVLDFKEALVKQFFKMRNALHQVALNQKNNEWLENRSKGKAVRKQQTDTIKKFIEYAENQGSKNARKHYYTRITSMQNEHLYIIQGKFKNVRDALSDRQLSFQVTCDQIVKKALIDGMEDGLHYKDIYQKARRAVISFCDLMPRTIVPEIKEIT